MQAGNRYHNLCTFGFQDNTMCLNNLLDKNAIHRQRKRMVGCHVLVAFGNTDLEIGIQF